MLGCVGSMGQNLAWIKCMAQIYKLLTWFNNFFCMGLKFEEGPKFGVALTICRRCLVWCGSKI